jgi:hypothetical protein
MVHAVRDGNEFAVRGAWPLPDGSTLTLHQRAAPWITVQRVQRGDPRLRLASVAVPVLAPPGAPVPVTYEWSGDWNRLTDAIALLTWRRISTDAHGGAEPPGAARWLHDHAVALGALHAAGADISGGFRVIERTAMLPPRGARGTYRLEAKAIHRRTGEALPLEAPLVTVTIDASARPHAAPPLDLVTQVRELASLLPRGPAALPHVFEEIARIGQYDPVQDYAAQLEASLAHRLHEEPDVAEWSYGLALARVLRRRVAEAIQPLERAVALDPNSAAARGYLGVVYLHELRPWSALAALEPVRDAPAAPRELHALRAVALALTGRLLAARDEWARFETAPPRAP